MKKEKRSGGSSKRVDRVVVNEEQSSSPSTRESVTGNWNKEPRCHGTPILRGDETHGGETSEGRTWVSLGRDPGNKVTSMFFVIRKHGVN